MWFLLVCTATVCAAPQPMRSQEACMQLAEKYRHHFPQARVQCASDMKDIITTLPTPRLP